MPLIDLWKTNRDLIENYVVRQLVQFAGDGKLSDGSTCSGELREFLSRISSTKLCTYVEQSLGEAFPDSGFVLQDLVNELGRRLDYTVTNGRYRGHQSHVGCDGVWVAPENWALIVEVKTTDTYRLNLETLIGYRNRLKKEGQIGDESSILIIVGRQDTGDLEAQIRGSRHAWDIRLMSAESLGKLVTLKEEAGDELTAARIRSLLVPHEYTRLDELIEVVFVTAEDIKRPADEMPDEALIVSELPQIGKSSHERTSQTTIEEIRQSLVETFARTMQKELVKKSKAQYWSADKKFRVCCTVSKYYERSDNYWYGYRQTWHEFLEEAEHGYLLIGCVGDAPAFALPHEFMSGLLDKLNTTEPPDGRMYWHLHLAENDPGRFVFRLKGAGQTVSVDDFRFDPH